MGDIEVPSGKKLTIAEGTKVFAAADKDLFGTDGESSILIRGILDVQGTTPKPVTLSSSRDASFVHFLGSGQTGVPPTQSDWQSLTFDVPGCGCSIWGVAAGATNVFSRIVKAHVANSPHGIRIINLQAPSLIDMTFGNIAGSKHIFVSNTDTYIPSGYYDAAGCTGNFVELEGEWKLLPGTYVVVTNSTAAGRDLSCAGETGLVDIFMGGRLTATGAPGTGNNVYFEPEVPHATTGNDWGGLFLSFYSEGSTLDYVDIGYAANPIYMFYPTNQSVTNSYIHHFAETGLWAHGFSGGNGPTLTGLNVERGSELNALLGDTGIFIDQADATDLTESTISLLDRADTQRGIGVYLFDFYPLLGASRGFTFKANCIEGAGLVSTNNADDIGLFASRVRGGTYLDVDISDNAIFGWKKFGMYVYQGVAITPSGNWIYSCGNGVDVVHPAYGPAFVDFLENRIEVLQTGPTRFCLRTDDASETRLGPQSAGLGANQLAVHQSSQILGYTKFINDGDSSDDVLNATDNYWYTWNPTTEVFTNYHGTGQIPAIDIRLAPAGYDIDYVPALERDAPLDLLECTSSSGAQLAQGEALDMGRSGGSTTHQPEFFLGTATPNPAREGVAIDLVIPSERIGEYTLEVFDVGGRRVYQSLTRFEQVGGHLVEWNGRDQEERKVRSGIYFMRISGPQQLTDVQKVVLLK